MRMLHQRSRTVDSNGARTGESGSLTRTSIPSAREQGRLCRGPLPHRVLDGDVVDVATTEVTEEP